MDQGPERPHVPPPGADRSPPEVDRSSQGSWSDGGAETDRPSRPGSGPTAWAPPDAAAPNPWDVQAGVAVDPEGPPPPPWERERGARRRRLGAILAVAGVVILIIAGVALAGLLPTSRSDESAATAPEAEPNAPLEQEAPPGPDGDLGPAPEDGPAPAPEGAPSPAPAPPEVEELEPPDPSSLTGTDGEFATLFSHVEASERVMMAFQRDLAETLASGGLQDVEEFLAAAEQVAADAADDLSAVREDLETSFESPEADAVRETYLEHLDAWHTFMEAIADDAAAMIGPDGESSRYDLEINATAVDFANAVERHLPDDAAPEVREYANDLLDRGFRFEGEAQV